MTHTSWVDICPNIEVLEWTFIAELSSRFPHVQRATNSSQLVSRKRPLIWLVPGTIGPSAAYLFDLGRAAVTRDTIELSTTCAGGICKSLAHLVDR
jgi:hypothetical protein